MAFYPARGLIVSAAESLLFHSYGECSHQRAFISEHLYHLPSHLASWNRTCLDQASRVRMAVSLRNRGLP